VFYKDIHGDTAVHAAASAGSSQSLEILLLYNKSHPENNFGMTAVHMSHNVDCLQVITIADYAFPSTDLSLFL
jgi:ankyrin repeat protein